MCMINATTDCASVGAWAVFECADRAITRYQDGAEKLLKILHLTDH